METKAVLGYPGGRHIWYSQMVSWLPTLMSAYEARCVLLFTRLFWFISIIKGAKWTWSDMDSFAANGIFPARQQLQCYPMSLMMILVDTEHPNRIFFLLRMDIFFFFIAYVSFLVCCLTCLCASVFAAYCFADLANCKQTASYNVKRKGLCIPDIRTRFWKLF